MPGPLYNPNARRRNIRKIPTTALNASGPSGPRPPVPSWVVLNKPGMKWWKWAWKTPQACGWGQNVGMESLVARRASLEDDLDVLERANTDVVEQAELLDLLEQGESIRWLFQRLVAMATPRLALQKEMREIDDRLGLTPKGLAALHWVIVDDDGAGRDEVDAAAAQADAEQQDELEARRQRTARDA